MAIFFDKNKLIS